MSAMFGVIDAISRLRDIGQDLSHYSAGDILPDGEIVVSGAMGLESSGLRSRPVSVYISGDNLPEAQAAGWVADDDSTPSVLVKVTKYE